MLNFVWNNKNTIKMRYFNTSGPNIQKEHYTLKRKELIKKGVSMVEKKIL